jgi:hypothetical protein
MLYVCVNNKIEKMQTKIPGRYKGTRKRKVSPAIVRVECPGCGWHSDPLKLNLAEQQYHRHLLRFHYSALHCPYCQNEYPNFDAISLHIREDHKKKDWPMWVKKAYGDDQPELWGIEQNKISWPCPVYITYITMSGVEESVYVCPRCRTAFARKKPCLMHMGFVSNIPASCRC